MKTLREQAIELKIPYVGVKKEVLEAKIAEANAENKVADNPKEEERNKVKKPKSILVYKDALHPIRYYGLETHGENFIELAEEFAGKHGYLTELVN